MQTFKGFPEVNEIDGVPLNVLVNDVSKFKELINEPFLF